MHRSFRRSLASFAFLAAGCQLSVAEDDNAASATEALTSGALDASIGVAGRVDTLSQGERLLGRSGTRLLFVGDDAIGTYVAARDSAKLDLDASYGESGRAYVRRAAPGASTTKISVGSVLADGRVLLTGVHWLAARPTFSGMEAMPGRLVAAAVSADGKHADMIEPSNLPDAWHGQGKCLVPVQSGTSILAMADGSVVVGAGIACEEASAVEARLYRFTLTGTTLAFSSMVLRDDSGARFTTNARNPVPVYSELTEPTPGKLFIKVPTHSKFLVVDTTTSPGSVVRTIAFAAGPVWSSPLAGGGFQLGGREDVEGRDARGLQRFTRCSALKHLTPALTLDTSFGSGQAAGRCLVQDVPWSTLVPVLTDSTGRLLTVGQGVTQLGLGKYRYDTIVKRQTSAGASDPTFGAGGQIVIEGARPADAAIDGQFLYLDLYVNEGSVPGPPDRNGRPTIVRVYEGGHLRRVRL